MNPYEEFEQRRIKTFKNGLYLEILVLLSLDEDPEFAPKLFHINRAGDDILPLFEQDPYNPEHLIKADKWLAEALQMCIESHKYVTYGKCIDSIKRYGKLPFKDHEERKIHRDKIFNLCDESGLSSEKLKLYLIFL
jgi:hypothetical protein